MEIDPQFRKWLSGDVRGARAAVVRLALWLASIPYGLVVRVRNVLYDIGVLPEHRVDRPVIAVGNITAGGTGKTPAVEFVVRWFLDHGARPAILSRGYGAADGRNDEALLLAARLPDVPHRQHKDRFQAAVAAMKLDGANALVLDDGFQHRRLARFGNVVLIDATCPFGYGHLLPRGLLREPRKGLRRADVIVVTRADQVGERELSALLRRLDRLAPQPPRATAIHAPTAAVRFPGGDTADPSVLKGKRLGLFCSIGNPDAFRRTVEQLGAAVEWAAEYPDHHWYSRDAVANICRADNEAVEAYVTTEKDAVKLGRLDGGDAPGLWPDDRKLWVLQVELRLTSGEEAVAQLLKEALRAALYDENAE
ncbi:MAG: tetraacyldisaccharide 4'-kinase [Planctomycetota bacterium]